MVRLQNGLLVFILKLNKCNSIVIDTIIDYTVGENISPPVDFVHLHTDKEIISL